MKRAGLLVVAIVVCLSGRVPAGQQTAAVAARDLAGTWTLERVQQELDGKPTAVQNPRGLLVFDTAGHVFEAATRANRQLPPQSSGITDAQYTFQVFSGFWGGYRLDGQQKTLTFQAEGAVSPNVMGREFTRSFELAGNRLTITSRPGEPHLQGITQWTWERVPTVENLSPTYRNVLGFWQHVVEKRLNLTTGTTISETKRAPSIIVYTPSGYVGVHFPPLGRQKFASDAPTDEEARAALRGYVGYFGALAVYPNMVFHQILAGVGGTSGTLKRPLELSGSEVTIKFPTTTNAQGQQQTTWVTLKRLSGEKDMLP